jgi:hypothetical protein
MLCNDWLVKQCPRSNVKTRENVLIEHTVEKCRVCHSVGKEAEEDINLSPQGAMTHSLHREKIKRRTSSHGVVKRVTTLEVTAYSLFLPLTEMSWQPWKSP